MINSQLIMCGDMQQILFVSLLLSLLCCSGCAIEEDGDTHLEHLNPAHKPTSYADGVEQLSNRGKRYFSNDLSNDEVNELLDIVNWLPELAADSNLKRPQWEQVQAATVQLQMLMQLSSDSRGSEQWNNHIALFTELIPFADSMVIESKSSRTAQQDVAEEPSHD